MNVLDPPELHISHQDGSMFVGLSIGLLRRLCEVDASTCKAPRASVETLVTHNAPGIGPASLVVEPGCVSLFASGCSAATGAATGTMISILAMGVVFVCVASQLGFAVKDCTAVTTNTSASLLNEWMHVRSQDADWKATHVHADWPWVHKHASRKPDHHGNSTKSDRMTDEHGLNFRECGLWAEWRW